MKKTHKISAAAAGVAALSIMFGAIGPVSSQGPQERVELVFFDPNRAEFEKEINLDGKRFGSGDMIMIKEVQFDPETCDRAGTVFGRIQIIKLAGRQDAVFTGDFTLLLPDGKITVGGVARFAGFEQDAPVFAVTGGTEAFRDASGEVSFEEGVSLCDKRGSLTTVDLLLGR